MTWLELTSSNVHDTRETSRTTSNSTRNFTSLSGSNPPSTPDGTAQDDVAEEGKRVTRQIRGARAFIAISGTSIEFTGWSAGRLRSQQTTAVPLTATISIPLF
jgi:hypothetical protein